MPGETSRYRPLISRQDLNPAECNAARRGTLIVLAVAVAGFSAIATLVLAYPGTNDMLSLIGP